MEFGGEETQRPPPPSTTKPDLTRCSFCDKQSQSDKKLPTCSRCKAAAFCDGDCQKAAWKRHKKVCVAVEGYAPVAIMKPRVEEVLPLTWAEVEQYGGATVVGKTLAVRIIANEGLQLGMPMFMHDTCSQQKIVLVL